MKDTSQSAYIDVNTVLFAQNVIRSLEDMAGLSFEMDKTSMRKKPFSSPFNMLAYIHFAGGIQGEYLLGLDEITAAKLAECYEPGMSAGDLRLREEYGSFVKEMVNTAVGRSIPILEQSFGDLTYAACILVYGEIEFPKVMSGNLMISGDAGKIQCGFSLNLARLKIGQRLEEALRELEKKTIEAHNARKEIETVRQLIPSALIAVDSDGKILPGHSRTVISVLGYHSEEDIVGADLSKLLGLENSGCQILNKFLLLFKSSNIFPLEEFLKMCEGRFTNRQGRTFKLDWLPVVNDQNRSLDKLLVIIEDIT